MTDHCMIRKFKTSVTHTAIAINLDIFDFCSIDVDVDYLNVFFDGNLIDTINFSTWDGCTNGWLNYTTPTDLPAMCQWGR